MTYEDKILTPFVSETEEEGPTTPSEEGEGEAEKEGEKEEGVE